MPLRSLGRLLGSCVALDPGSWCVRALTARLKPPRGGDNVVDPVSPKEARRFTGHRSPLNQLASSGELGPSSALGEVLEIPSLVAKVDPGRAALLRREPVGEEARALALARRPGVTIIRPIERGAIADPAAAERLFAHVFSSMPDERAGRVWTSRPRVVCGIGAGITEVEQRAFADALDRAGARSVLLVPSLAACAYALDRQGAARLSSPKSKDARKEQGSKPPGLPGEGASLGGVHLVAELGHGRTGVGLASRSGVLASRHVPLGACDLDLALSGYLRRRGLLVSTDDARRLREGLGLPAEPVGREDGPARDEPLEDIEDVLPRHVGAALAPHLELLVDSVREVLSVAPGEVVEDLLDEGLVLAGAPALTPGLAGAISRDLELPARVAPEPRTLRVRGLALVAEDETLLDEVGVRV